MAAVKLLVEREGRSRPVRSSDTIAEAGDLPLATHNHDSRYYTETEVDTALAAKAALSHVHAAADVTSGVLVAARIPVLPSLLAPSVDRGDASVTLTWGTDAQLQRFLTTLTADRIITLSVTGAITGAWFRILRIGLGAFTLDVGGLKTIPSLTSAQIDVVYDGSAWILAGSGVLL